ncbi:unnamed protein product [Pieris macdunnoughi]|uniref:Uncharacterized protein n=1 Tax=Pieris macdunnoughi TaxID=345717 RepID=A0A821WUH3_9NEOP|nr:unnamed protein product [Pieris macdunnoughi]
MWTRDHDHSEECTIKKKKIFSRIDYKIDKSERYEYYPATPRLASITYRGRVVKISGTVVIPNKRGQTLADYAKRIGIKVKQEPSKRPNSMEPGLVPWSS